MKISSLPDQLDNPKVKVCYQVQSTGGGIGEVRLFQNGKLIKSDGFYRDIASQSKAATIKLASINSRAVYQDMRSLAIKEKQSPGAHLLRAKGEFEKADKLLELTQSHLSELMTLKRWAEETNMSADEFNAKLAQWEADFALAAKKYRTDTELAAGKLTGEALQQ